MVANATGHALNTKITKITKSFVVFVIFMNFVYSA
jgi:hypothetical protein